MADNLIRWKKGDYIRLGQAVASFNRKIKELQVDELEYLPELQNYEDLKKDILSRKELNRVINSLKAFNTEGAETLVKTKAGEELTFWEFKEVKKARTRAIKRLTQEKLEVEQGAKYVGMGDERIEQINSTIESLQDLENRKGYEFKRVMKRALKLGETDNNLKKAQTYRENFMFALESLEGYDNIDKLKEKLKSIKNPISFYEYVKQSDVLSDLFIYYKDKATAQTYGGFVDNQDAFNYALEVELGIGI